MRAWVLQPFADTIMPSAATRLGQVDTGAANHCDGRLAGAESAVPPTTSTTTRICPPWQIVNNCTQATLVTRSSIRGAILALLPSVLRVFIQPLRSWRT